MNVRERPFPQPATRYPGFFLPRGPPLAKERTTGIESITSLREPPPRANSPKPPTGTPTRTLLYERAAERWREFGSVPERAYALLGQGR